MHITVEEMLYFLNSKYAESILAYHTAIELSPDTVSGKTLYNMGSSYAALELFTDAVKCFFTIYDFRSRKR